MRVLRSIAAALLVTVCAPVLTAQTVRWALPPEYKSVDQISDHLYKIAMVKGVGVATQSGEIVIDPTTADSITDFSEGKALALKADGDKYQLVGIFGEDGKMVKPADDDFYVGDFPFFSEGMLPVCNSRGKYGFINANGDLVVDFKYSSVHPFCQGYASCGVAYLIGGESIVYVDANGVEMKLDRSLGKVSLGTSFYQDKAVVRTKNGDYAVIGLNGQIVELNVNPTLHFDWKFRLSDEKQEDGYQPSIVINGPSPYQDNGKYGYARNGRHVVTAQFSDARPFYDGYAVAALRPEAYGILQYIEGSIACDIERGDVQADKGKESVVFNVTLPEAFKNEDLNLRCYGKDHDSQYFLAKDGSTRRSASFLVPSNPHTVEIVSGQLTLFQKTFEPLGPDASLQVSVSVTAKRANEKDQQSFAVVFTNSGKQSVSFTVEVTGSKLVCKKTTVTVPAGGKARVTGYFKDVVDDETRLVTVKYGDETYSKSVKVTPW